MIASVSGGLDPDGWESLADADPAIVGVLGTGADTFDEGGGSSSTSLAEFALLGQATWNPGVAWSLGFPIDSELGGFDVEFQYSTLDGQVVQGQVVFTQIPEPTAAVLLSLALGLWPLRRRG